MQRTVTFLGLAMMTFAVIMLGMACSNSSDPTDDDQGGTTPVVESTECIRCHTDEARLIATAEPEEEPGGEEPSGEG